jgi:putative SOS response-associated peptidase YedK
MCGHYLRRSDKKHLIEAFSLPDSATLSYLSIPSSEPTVSPATQQPVIRHSRHTGERELVLMRWGLVPQFARALSDFPGSSTINARADALLDKPMWRIPFETRRCLIPADGFYEWRQLAAMTDTTRRRIRQPYVFTLKSNQPFAFAGLWSAWKDPNGTWLQSFTIVTTEANELMSSYHHRMPVILAPEDHTRWLTIDRKNAGQSPAGAASLPLDLLRSYPSEAMQVDLSDPLDFRPTSYI